LGKSIFIHGNEVNLTLGRFFAKGSSLMPVVAVCQDQIETFKESIKFI